MRTFCIQTLGCKVNQYESEQLATLLRQRGLVAIDSPADADLRIVNTCSVTIQAASKSRQTVRRLTRLPVLNNAFLSGDAGVARGFGKTILTGCWATSDTIEAQQLPGVDAVLTHHHDVAAELDRLLDRWTTSQTTTTAAPEPKGDDGWMIEAGTPAAYVTNDNKPALHESVKGIPRRLSPGSTIGTVRLPLLCDHQTGRQRALLKIQDGCDAHCTYCIIPQLRPTLWSKPIDDVVEEAQRLVDSGHVEIVLTGIFLGAYGHETALRRRRRASAHIDPLAHLVDALCTRVPGLRRLRFSSLEPGDLTPDLIASFRSHAQVVPHFHLPLQSGSDAILHRMNRQYTRDDYLRMIDAVHQNFDRPALTTDIIVGFPGETGTEFAQTLDIVDRVRFIHIHAFSFSPRPRTAAARWQRHFIRGPIVNQRIERLTARANAFSFEYRKQFLGQTVEVLAERASPSGSTLAEGSPRHGRCERYFDVHFECADVEPGDLVRVTIDHVTPVRTAGRRAVTPATAAPEIGAAPTPSPRLTLPRPLARG